MSDEKYIPKVLKSKITAEEIEQVKRSATEKFNSLGNSFLRNRSVDLVLAGAVRDEEAYLNDLQHCAAEVAAGRMSQDDYNTRTQTDKEFVARALLTQGRFREAEAFAIASGVSSLIDYVREVRDAVDAPDDHFCDCSPQVVDNKTYPNFHQTGVQYSIKHGGFTPIINCSCCGHKNVTHTRPANFLDLTTVTENKTRVSDDSIFRTK